MGLKLFDVLVAFAGLSLLLLATDVLAAPAEGRAQQGDPRTELVERKKICDDPEARCDSAAARGSSNALRFGSRVRAQ